MRTYLPFVSIVIVNFNRKKYLKRLFESLNKTDYPREKMELILVDNGSKDGSVEFVRRNYKNVRILLNKVNNYCKANNLGIANSNGEFVSFINNDTKVDRKWLIELIKVIAKDPSIAGVGSKLLSLNGKIQNAGHLPLPNFYWDERGAGLDVQKFNKTGGVPSICGAAALYRKNCLEKVGLFDEDFVMYGEDTEISQRLRNEGWKLFFAPKSKVYHEFHGSGNGELSRFYIERNRLLFLAKHNPEKLSNSLIGNGYFTAKNNTESFSRLYDVLPDVVSKLIKHNEASIAECTLKEIFEELNNILHYEHKQILEDLNRTNKDLEQKTRESSKNISLKDRELSKQRSDINRLNTDLKQAIEDLRQREGVISKLHARLSLKNSEDSDIKKETKRYKSELNRMTDQIKDKEKELAKLHSETDQIKDKEKELAKLHSETDRLNTQLSGQIQTFQAQVDALTKETSLKDGEISQERERVSSLKKEIDRLNAELTDKKDEFLLKDGETIEKDTSIDKLNARIHKLNEELEHALKEASFKNTDLESRDKIITEKEKEVSGLRSEIERFKSDISAKEENFSRQVSETDRLKQEIIQYKERLKDRESRLEEGMQGYINALAQVQMLQAQSNATGQEAAQKNGQLLEKDAQLKRADSQVSDLNQKLNHAMERLVMRESDLSKQRSDLDQVWQQFNEKISVKEKELSSSRLDVEGLRSELQQKIEELRDKDSDLNESRQNMANQLGQIQTLESQINNKGHEISLKNMELLQERNRLESLRKETESLAAQLTDKRDEMILKDDQIIEKNTEINKLSSNIKELNIRMKEMADEIVSREKLVSEREAELSGLHSELNRSNQVVSKKTQELSAKENMISEKDKEIKAISDELSFMNNIFRQKADELLIKDGQIIEKDARLNVFSDEMQQLDEALANASEALLMKEGELTRQRADLERDRADFNQKLSEKDKEIKAISDELSFMNNIFRQKADELLIKDGQIIEKENIISGKDSELSRLASDIESLRDEIRLKAEMLNNREKVLSETRVELNGVYTSTGFKFLLRPLWTVLWTIKRPFRDIKKKLGKSVWFLITVCFYPLFKLLPIFFYFERFLGFLSNLLPSRPLKDRKITPFENLKISIVIPSWNGIDLLHKCLDSIYKLDEFKDSINEVVVIDDFSTDGTSEFVRERFPQVKLFRNKKNMGFGWTCNRGVKEAANELIVLINNDIIVTRDFIRPLKEHFRDEKVFAVTPKLYGWDWKTFLWGMHMGRVQDGYIRLWNEAETGNSDRIYEPSPSIFAIGGAMVFRRNDFLWLGGFDEIYRPNCWEDIDISYRAWKRGLKVIYEPKSLLYHKGRATLSYERHKEIKNELSFMWKNITDRDLLKEHFNALSRLLYQNRRPFLRGFIWSLYYLPKTLTHRFKDRRYICVRDKKIIDACMQYYRNFERNGFRHTTRTVKKNLLIVTPFMPYPLNTGGRIRIHTLARLLKDKFNIFLLSLIDHENEARFIPELKSVFKDVHTVLLKTPIPDDIMYPSRYRYAYSQHLIDKMKELQKSLPLDLIQIESNELLYLTEHVKHIPVIYTEHDVSILTFGKSYYRDDNNLVDFLKRFRFHHNSYKDIDRVVALSEKDGDILNGFFPKKDISLITTGVDLEHFSFTPDTKRPPRLIFVGNYLHYPNEDAIVYFANKIFPFIKKDIPGVELMIVGSNPTERVRLLDKNDRHITVTGEVSDVAPYLKQAAVFVNPIRLSAGIKGKVLEAMAKGTPVVSTLTGSLGLFAKQGRDILIAKDRREFVTQVRSLLEDRDLYLEIANNARRLVEKKYDWNKLASDLGAVYEKTAYDFNSLREEEKRFSSKRVDKVIKSVNTTVSKAIDKTKDTYFGIPEEGPEELHIELDYNCNCKCIMCDLWDHEKRISLSGRAVREKLSFEGIKDLVEKSRYLKDVKTIVLSGGEPFLRKDFVEIFSFFIDRFPRSSIGILTNFFDTELVLRKLHQVLDYKKLYKLWLGTSIDGVGRSHDRIRGRRGAFGNLKKTIERCKREFPEIDLCATFTLTPDNVNQVIPAKNFSDNQGIGFMMQFVVPKEARQRFLWKKSQLRKVEKDVRSIINTLVKNFEGGVGGKDVIESIESIDNPGLISNLYYLANFVEYQRSPRRFFKKCIAGKKFAMLSPFGELYFCPGLKDRTVADIKSHGFDESWISDRAEGMRSYIDKAQCHCWLVCILFPVIEKVLELARDKKTNSLIPDYPAGDKDDLQKTNIVLNDSEYESRKIILQSTPKGIGIGMHYNCNADCVFCLGGKHANASLDVFKRFFEQRLYSVLPRAEYINFCGFGEMLLMPEAKELLGYINKKVPNVNKIITTNGIPLSDAICDRLVASKYDIQISLQASTPQLHKWLTRTQSFERILKNIERLRSIRPGKENPALSLVFIANTLNIENLPDFVRLARSIGVDDVLCNYMTAYTPAHLKLSCFFKQDLTNAKLDQAQRIAEDLGVRLKLPPKFGNNGHGNGRIVCNDPWQYFYVEREGSVLPCCYAGSHIDYLNKKDFSDIWNSEVYQSLRKSLAGDIPNSWCRFCPKSSNFNINDIRAHVTMEPKLQRKVLQDVNLKKLIK